MKIRLVAATLLLFVLPVSAAPELRLAADDWPPYTNKHLYRYGFATALVTEALRRAGYQSSLAIAPWGDIVAAADVDAFDAVVAAWKTKARENIAVFSEPYLINRFVLVQKIPTDGEAVNPDGGQLRVGVVEDYAYSEAPLQMPGAQLIPAGSVDENVRRLQTGELDYVLADSRVAKYVIDSRVLGKQLELANIEVANRELRMAVLTTRPDAAEIVAAFNTSLAAMRADGSYNAILNSFRVSE